MQIARGTDYAVRVVCHLATLPPRTRIKIGELARVAEVPTSFLSKILQRLTASGLVHSRRGSAGGFELARPASAMSLLDVVVSLEGELALNMCLSASDRCHRQPWCAVHQVWAEAQSRMVEVLRAATIDQIADTTDSALRATRTGRCS